MFEYIYIVKRNDIYKLRINVQLHTCRRLGLCYRLGKAQLPRTAAQTSPAGVHVVVLPDVEIATTNLCAVERLPGRSFCMCV